MYTYTVDQIKLVCSMYSEYSVVWRKVYRKLEWYQDGTLHVSIQNVFPVQDDTFIKLVMTAKMYSKPVLTVQMYSKPVLTVQMYIKRCTVNRPKEIVPW